MNFSDKIQKKIDKMNSRQCKAIARPKTSNSSKNTYIEKINGRDAVRIKHDSLPYTLMFSKNLMVDVDQSM